MRLLVLLAALGAAGAFSTCRSLDLEAARRKRIEAVRGQILSKLRLPGPPPAEGPPRPLPEDVRALYNSTRERLQQRERLRPPPDPDDYYAKELHRFDMEPPGDGPLARWRPTARSVFFVFNASRVRAQGRAPRAAAPGRAADAAAARGPRRAPGAAAGALPGLRQLLVAIPCTVRAVQVTAEDEWLWFDVTDTVQQWLSDTEPLGVFKLSVHCPCDEGPDDMRVTIEGFERQRGDLQSIARKLRRVPHVLAMALPPERANQLHSDRRRRALDSDFCFGSEEAQLLRAAPVHRFPAGPALEVDPRAPRVHGQRVSWARVPSSGAPTPSTARFWPCTTSTTPAVPPPPAASPQALDPLPIVYYVGRRARVEQLSDMVVRACKCS